VNPKRLLEPEHAAVLMREPWGAVSLELNKIGQSEKWMTTHPSFTAWVKAFAQAAKVQESSLWRMISAGRYYSSLGAKVGTLKLPNLVEISKFVTAEQFELVEKISRVASSGDIEQLLAGVLDGTLTRDKLRTRWRIYRDMATPNNGAATITPTVAKKVVLPKTRRGAPLYGHSVEKLLVTLIELQPMKGWIGNSNPHFFKTYYRPPIALSGIDPSDTSFQFHPDILVLVQDSETAPLQFHIVEVIPAHVVGTSAVAIKAHIAQLYADYFWLAVGDCGDAIPLAGVPTGSGLITFSPAGIAVRHHPVASGQNRLSGELAKMLLTKLL
jgi:hypothetical protein